MWHCDPQSFMVHRVDSFIMNTHNDDDSTTDILTYNLHNRETSLLTFQPFKTRKSTQTLQTNQSVKHNTTKQNRQANTVFFWNLTCSPFSPGSPGKPSLPVCPKGPRSPGNPGFPTWPAGPGRPFSVMGGPQAQSPRPPGTHRWMLRGQGVPPRTVQESLILG